MPILCLNIANGRLGLDKSIGSKTCKGVSTTDYVILSPLWFPLVNQFEVLPFDPLLSDAHCGIHFSVFCKNNQLDKSSNIVTNEIESISKPVSIGTEAETFRNHLNSVYIVAFVKKIDEASLRTDL